MPYILPGAHAFAFGQKIGDAEAIDFGEEPDDDCRSFKPGSIVLPANTSGAESGRLLYKPWGETRFSTGTTPTTWRFTGQREDATIGLYFYNARSDDAALGRFPQPDTGDPTAVACPSPAARRR